MLLNWPRKWNRTLSIWDLLTVKFTDHAVVTHLSLPKLKCNFWNCLSGLQSPISQKQLSKGKKTKMSLDSIITTNSHLHQQQSTTLEKICHHQIADQAIQKIHIHIWIKFN